MKILIAVLIVILIGLQYRLWIADGSFADIDRLEQEVASQAEENTALEARNEDLRNEVEELQTGMDAIEEHARHELGLIQEGETFILIVEDQDGETSAPRTSPLDNE